MTELALEGPKRTPPYVAFSSLKTFLSNLRESGGVPIAIDSSVYGNMSGSLRSQLRGALKFFGMAGADNKPTAVMHRAVEATADQGVWRAFVAEVLQEHYAPILAHPLTTTTPGALLKEFQTYYLGASDLMEKAITFFIYAAKEAGVPLSPRLTERQKPQRRSTTPRRRETNGSSGSGDGGGQSSGGAGKAVETVPQVDPPKPRKVSEHQVVLIEIINTYTDMDDEMRTSLLKVVGFIATKGVTS
jgi:hypothetical protein